MKKSALTPRDRRLRRKFGITEADYESMLAAQGGACAVCQKLPRKKALAVDHDHKTKRVRGLLCFNCNRYRIGRYIDPVSFERAAQYLRRKVALGL